MEKVNANKKSRSARTVSDFMLKIVAVAIAVIVWFILSITQYPTINKTILNVPVDFSMRDTTAENKGLSALDYKDITVNVEIQGMNYEIGAYTANDLIATVNLDDVTKEGTYKLDIDVRSAHSADKCSIVSVSPETVEVKFEHIVSKKFELSVSANDVGTNGDHILNKTVASPAEIEIQGAENEIERIDSVVAVYSDPLTLSEDRTVKTDRIILYDKDRNILENSNYKFSAESVDISFEVYRRTTLNLSADITNLPPGFDINSLSCTLSQDSVQIISPQLDRPTAENVKLSPSISIYDITKGKTFKYDVASMFTKGEINQSGVDQIEVTFDLEGYEEKSFKIDAAKIQFTNIPAGKKAELDMEHIPNVTLFGPKESIDKLKAADIRAVVDLSDISANGSVSHEVVVYAENYSDIWNIGTHEAVINVTDR